MTKEKNTQPLLQLFSANTKLADMLETNYKLIPTITQFGIELGFGETTIGTACRKCKISTQSFLMVCNTYTFPNYAVSAKDLKQADIADIVLFLRQSHKYYNKLILKLHDNMDLLLKTCKNLPQQTLKKFFDDYCAEVKKHFDYEENTVFPYINGLLKNEKANSKYNIEKFEKNHSNIEEKLDDLKNIIIKYFPKCCDEDVRIDTLLLIFNLKDDLQKHTFIEDSILIPLVAQLENK